MRWLLDLAGDHDRFERTTGTDDLRAIAALAQIEMLESGFTQLAGFHYPHHDPARGLSPTDVIRRVGRSNGAIARRSAA